MVPHLLARLIVRNIVSGAARSLCCYRESAGRCSPDEHETPQHLTLGSIASIGASHALTLGAVPMAAHSIASSSARLRASRGVLGGRGLARS